MKPAIVLILIILLIVLGFIVFKYIMSASPIAGKVSVSGDGIYKSTDQGETWKQLSTAKETKESGRIRVADLGFYAVEISPQDSQTIFAGTIGNGLVKSVDGGTSWKKIGKGALASTSDVLSIAIDPKDPQNIYLATYYGSRGRVLKSTDGGENFKEVFITNTDKSKIVQVGVDTYDNAFIFAATSNGIFLASKDFGEFWQSIKDFDKSISRFFINSRDTREIYVSLGSDGLFKTVDKGVNWTDLSKKIDEKINGYDFKEIKDLAIVAEFSKVYVGTESKIIYSADGGENFEEIKSFPAGGDFQFSAIAIDPLNPTVIYVAGKTQVYKSIDGGIQWRIKELGSKKNISVLKIDPANSSIIYVGFGK